jgi:type I restriction enzyme S subunit
MREPIARSSQTILGILQESKTFFRLSPAEPGKAQCFAVKRGEIDIRIDPYYNLPEHRVLIERLMSSQYSAVPINDERVVKNVIEGRITPKEECYTDDDSAPVYLRAQNIEEGYLNFSDTKRLTPEAFHKEAKAILLDGDIVLTIDGVLLGIAAVHRASDAPCCVSNHMVRLITGEKVLPDFLSWFLNSPAGQRQIKRGITGSAIPGIRTDAIERILISLPPLPVQREMVMEMEQSRRSQRRKLQQADALLSGLDAFLLERLGLTVNRLVRTTFIPNV